MTFFDPVILESGSTQSGLDIRPRLFLRGDRIWSGWPTTPFSFPISMSDRFLTRSGYLVLGFRSVFLGNLRKLKIQVTIGDSRVWRPYFLAMLVPLGSSTWRFESIVQLVIKYNIFTFLKSAIDDFVYGFVFVSSDYRDTISRHIMRMQHNPRVIVYSITYEIYRFAALDKFMDCSNVTIVSHIWSNLWFRNYRW